MIKGDVALEFAGAVDAIAFDKTGALTEEKSVVSNANRVDKQRRTYHPWYGNVPIGRRLSGTYVALSQSQTTEGRERTNRWSW